MASPSARSRGARHVTAPARPTKSQLSEAAGGTVPDLIRSDLQVLFCGINPGLYSAATGHHFARPGNRFWPALHQAGFTDRLLAAWEEWRLLERGYGITNLVARSTAAAAELGPEELRQGRKRLLRKVRRYRPRWVAVLGIGAFRAAFGRRGGLAGLQPESFGGSGLWVLPNPSGLNANHQLDDLVQAFRELLDAARAGSG
jgi:TDG/mug DNA glycosylase family protein